MSKDLMRDQFDKWFDRERMVRDAEFGSKREHYFEVWIASREIVVVKLPSPSDHEIYNDKSDFLHIDGESLMSSVRYAIEAQGLKVAQ